MKLSNELFSEAFQYFTRLDAEDARVTCRMFNEFAGQLCDVFGYKLRLSYLSVAKGTKKHTVSIKIRSANGREISFEDDEEEAMTRLKGAIRVAFVRNCEIKASVLSERMCQLFLESCSETAFFNMMLVNGTIVDGSTHNMESAALQNFLLSINISGVLDVRSLFRGGDYTRDFLLRCKENGIQTLRCRWQSIDLQGMQTEDVEGVVQELNQIS